jgi:hypothetical protein
MPDLNDNTLERIWAYAQDELGPAERENLEQEMREDPELASAVEEIRRSHDQVLRLAGLADKTDEDLVIEAMAEREKDLAAAADDKPRPAGKLLQFPASLAVALAACLAVFLGIQFMTSSPLSWSMQVEPLLNRNGEDTSPPALYTEPDLREIGRDFKKGVSEFYEKESGQRAGRWQLAIGISEQPDGLLLLEVQGSRRGHDESKETWTLAIEKQEPLGKLVSDFAQQVAEELLATPPPAP